MFYGVQGAMLNSILLSKPHIDLVTLLLSDSPTYQPLLFSCRECCRDIHHYSYKHPVITIKICPFQLDGPT